MNSVIQIFTGIAVCIVLMFIGLYFNYREGINQIRKKMMEKKPRRFVDFTVKGIHNAGGDGTHFALPGSEIPFSVNQMGGAEFTYNFWIRKEAGSNIYDKTVLNKSIDDRLDPQGANNFGYVDENKTLDAGLHHSDIVLLLKGEPIMKRYANLCQVKYPADGDTTVLNYKTDVLVKCPLIKFDRGTDRLTVQFNTYKSPDAVEERTPVNMCTNNSSDSWAAKTKWQFSVDGLDDANYVGHWFMVTVVIRDTTTTGMYPSRNKINCKIYINGVKKLDKYADGKLSEDLNAYSLLRQNRSPLWIFPIVKGVDHKTNNTVRTYQPIGDKKLSMAGGRYFNFAIEDNEVVTLYNNKFDIRPTITVTEDIPTFSDNKLTAQAQTGK